MKWLVGAACVAVIAAGGVYLNGVRVVYAQQQAAITTQLDARNALFSYSKAKPNEIAKVEAVCRVANKHPEMFNGDMAIKIVNTCNLAGISVYY